jgi:hypothetical protein
MAVVDARRVARDVVTLSAASAEAIPVGLQVPIEPKRKQKVDSDDKDDDRKPKPRPTRLAVLRRRPTSGRLHLYEVDAWLLGDNRCRKRGEWAWYHDDLAPADIKRLRHEHATMTVPRADGRVIDGVPCTLLPWRDFLRVFYLQCIKEPALIVGYGLAVDLVELTYKVTEARKGGTKAGSR